MLFLDERIGSRHYHNLIPHSHLTRLEAGDAMWSGAHGELVGVEIKKVLDAVNCMFSGRLADHQIPLMTQLYDVRYLVVEGVWRPDESGVLQYWREFPSKSDVICGRWADCTSGRKRLMYSSFESWLSSMEQLGGVRVRSTCSASATAAWLWQQYNWWQRTDHRSMDVMHMAQGNGAVLSRPTILRRILALLPHIGWDRSAVLAQRFPSVRSMVDAPLKAWYLKGQIAEKSAQDIQRVLNGETDT